MLSLEQYVKVIETGAVGRVEQWTSGPDLYSVEFNRDFATRKWFKESELELFEAPQGTS